MKFAKLIVTLYCCMVAFAQPMSDFYVRLIEFDKHYNRFVHRLCGWPVDRPADGPCKQHLGTFDIAEFRKAGEAASRLWPKEK